MKPLLAQWKAEILRTVRDRRFFMLTLLMPIGFYLIFISEEKGTLAIAGTTWNAYFMVSMATFGVVGSSVNTLGVRLAAERKSGWVRWLRTTPLSPVAYALAKIFTQLTISLGIVVAIFLVAHFDQKVSLPSVRWLEIAAWLWIGSIPFAALGVLIGLAGNAAQVLGTLVYLSLSLLGGLWTPVQALPRSMQELARYMPTYRFAHPAWDMLSGRPLHLSDIGILILYTLFFVLTAAIIQKQLDVRTEA